MLALGLAAAWLTGRVRARFSAADAAVAATVVLLACSIGRGADRRAAVTMGWEWIGLGLAYVLLRCLPRTPGESSALAGIFLATACALSATGFYQRFVEDPDTIAMYRKDPERALRLAGVANEPASRRRFEDRVLRSTEPRATFALANSLAGFLVGPAVFGLAAAGGWLAAGRPGRRRATDDAEPGRAIPLLLAAPPLLALVACLVLTKSRSAYVGLLAGLLAVALLQARRLGGRRIALAALMVLALLAGTAGAAAAGGVLDRQVLTESTKSFRYRAEWWRATWALIAESSRHFWGGVGPGNFAGPYLRHKLPTSSEEIKDPHNLLMEVWATSGAPAALALVGAIGLLIRETMARGGEASLPSGPVRPGGEAEVNPTASPDSATALRPEEAPPRATTWLWLAAGAGGLLGVVLLGRLDPLGSLDEQARWLVLALAWAASALLLAPLWQRRPAEGAELGAGMLAVAVNLLAAGGIGIPPVALGLWALGALGQDRRTDRSCGQLRTWGGRWLAFGLLIGVAALVGSFVGANRRTWTARAWMARGEAALRPSRLGRADVEAARRAFQKAADADPLSSRPLLALVELEVSTWLAQGARPGSLVWFDVSRHLDEAVSPPRSPDSLAVQRLRMDVLKELIRLQGPALSPQALEALRSDLANAAAKAVLLYPTSAPLNAELAEATAALGRYTEASRYAREALRLHALTPHADKKLPDKVRDRLKAAEPRWATGSPAGVGGRP